MLLTSALSFWGRLVLGLAKVKDKPEYGHPLSVVAGAAFLVFAGWLINGWILNYRGYLTSVYYGGIFGAGLEIFFLKLPEFWSQRNKPGEIKRLLASCSCFSAGVILSLILAFFQAAVWESGRLDVWLFGSTDYFNWALVTDYWLGYVNPDSFHLSYNEQVMFYDSIGTHIIFALYSLSSGETALKAISAFMLTAVIWSGLSVQLLVRKIFGLGFWISLFLTLGVIGGAFFNYLIAKGLVGQLAATAAFMAALTEIYSWPSGQKTAGDQVRFFIPVFCLFMVYQGGFAAFAAFLSLAAGAVHFFTAPQNSFFKRAFESAVSGLKPVFLSLALSVALVPFLSWRVCVRTLESARQAVGWKISFLSPWLLSGLPVYRPEYFTSLAETADYGFSYVLFLAALLGMCLAIGKLSARNSSGISDEVPSCCPDKLNTGLIYSISVIFIISILVYIVSFFVFDNKYQVWKFISYTGLPLSFVPAALIVCLAGFVKKKIIRYSVIGSIAVIAVCVGFGLENLKNLTKMPKTYYGIMSADSFLGTLVRIIVNEDPETNFIFNFSEPADMLLAGEIFKGSKISKFSVMNDSLYFKSNDVFPVINSNNSKYIFITDRDYRTLYNNSPGVREGKNIYVAAKDWVEEHGFADILGIDRERRWLIKDNWAAARILLPEGLRGKEVRVTVTLQERDKNPKSCQPRAYLGIHGPAFARSGPDYPEIYGTAGPELTKDGFLKASVTLEDNSDDLIRCVYLLEKIEVKEASDW
ncbi:MAG: hypothetical protein LBP22_11620 [Deltaproteobacteria bacterium]|jgi:hypothetical protein|nr:hypothetical protein [Deltaproteobacteria bacterium]